MAKELLNYLVDAAAFVVFVLLISTGFVLEEALPRGSGGKAVLWGLGRHDWGEVHFVLALILILLIAVHLLLHWRWIICVTKGHDCKNRCWRTVLASVILAAVAALAAAPFFSPVVLTGERGDHYGQRQKVELYGSEDIRGSSSLAEAAQLAGIPEGDLIRELNLPPGVSSQERLGRLRREYNFSMTDVREAVRRYRAREE
ncbi:MAG TPA: DUF4405 domain-containing protein [Oligoflexia bacterium]|nr:DUF4405 domain-containing protein [Oligoflexia bacterium]